MRTPEAQADEAFTGTAMVLNREPGGDQGLHKAGRSHSLQMPA
jgi:hypothetical protein